MKSIPRTSISMSKLVIVADLPASVVLVQGAVTGSRPIVLARPDATLGELAALAGGH